MDRIHKRFDFSIDEEIDVGNESLLEADLNDDKTVYPFGAIESASTSIVAKIDDCPTRERIDSLFASLKHRKRILLDTIAYVQEPKAVTDVNIRIEELQKNNTSVYSGPDICALLERAGAIKRVTEIGEELPSDNLEPEVVSVDGVEVYKPVSAPEVFWMATQEGVAAYEDYDPYINIKALLADEVNYVPIFKRVLELASSTPGAKTASYTAAIDDDPLVQEPRRYASFFLDKLEEVDAIEWREGWYVTDIGCDVLATL